MTVFGRVFLIGVQNALVYRWNFALRCAMGFVPLVGTFFFWGAVFEGRGDVGGYRYGEMITYFVLLLVLDALTTPADEDFQIASDIREGRINQMLIKPIHYGLFRFSLFVASRLVYAASAAGPLALMLAWFWPLLTVSGDGERWLIAVLAVAGSAGIQFMMAVCTGLLAFWLLDVSGVIFLLFGLEYLAGGHVFPLDLLPDPLLRAALALPFAYEFFFPMAVVTGKWPQDQLWSGLLVQWAWVAGLGGLAWWVWRMGLRRFAAVGG